VASLFLLNILTQGLDRPLALQMYPLSNMTKAARYFMSNQQTNEQTNKQSTRNETSSFRTLTESSSNNDRAALRYQISWGSEENCHIDILRG